jgi:hypothetical protein
MILKETRKTLGVFLINLGNSLLTDRNLERKKIENRLNNLKKFWFLADAPLFIDTILVERMYDSIFRPEFEVATRTKATGNIRSKELSNEISGAGELSIPTFIKISATEKINDKSIKTKTDNESLTEAYIQSPERRLEKLINLYVYSYPERLFWINSDLITIADISGNEVDWKHMDKMLDDGGIRPLVVLDLKEKSRVIPMAAECDKGGDVEIYKKLIEKIDPQNILIPKYPNYGSPNFDAQNKKYFEALHNSFDSSHAIRIVESSTNQGGKIDWIDYRLVGFKENEVIPLHLHCSPRGKYPTGTFAYQFIRRAEKYGVRILGTLKKGHDINTLAVYER